MISQCCKAPMINVGKDKDKYICHDCGLECELYEPIEDEAPKQTLAEEILTEIDFN